MIVLRQKEYSYNDDYPVNIVSQKNDINALRRLGYPKEYVDFLEKENPKIDSNSDDVIFARPMTEDEYGSVRFPGNEDFGPYSEKKDGKTFVALFYKDPFVSEDFGYSEISAELWYCVEDNRWYRKVKNGLFSKKFEPVSDIKTYLKK